MVKMAMMAVTEWDTASADRIRVQQKLQETAVLLI